MSPTRIGILGGAFDPVHIGHLILASEATHALGFDRIILMPGAQTPLKGRAPTASDDDRLIMLRESVRHLENWEVSDWEIRRGGLSYSINTALHLRERFPEASLHWIIGADQLERLPSWHKINELASLVRFAVALRNGDTLTIPSGLPSQIGIDPLPARRFDISSGEIRDGIRQGKPGIEFFLTEKAATHIRAKGLYRD